MNEGGNDNEILHSYLNETLPTLGLDPETYSPYVMGCLAANDGGNDDEENLEDLDQIMELLCASSETHSDDDTGVWDQFKSEVLKRHEEYRNILREKKDAELEELRKVRLISILFCKETLFFYPLTSKINVETNIKYDTLVHSSIFVHFCRKI